MDADVDINADVDHPELHLALDTGQQYLKAAYLFLYDKRPQTRHQQSGSLMKRRSIVFYNHQIRMRSRVLYALDEACQPPALRPVYGQDLKRILQNHPDLEEDVIEFFKPLVFGEDIPENAWTKEQIDKVKGKCRDLRSSQGAPDPLREFGPFNVLVDLLRYLYQTSIIFISRESESPNLGLPRNVKDFQDWDAGDFRIRVALPVPAGTTTEKARLYREAAEAAGIPNPYPVSEAAAALAFHVATTQKPSLHRTLAIVDIGASTADVEVDTVTRSSPLELAQVVKSVTAWCGGRFLNTACRTYLLERWQKYQAIILEALSDYESTEMTWERLGIAIETGFEKVKEEFDGSQNGTLDIPGLPQISAAGIFKRGVLTLTVDELRQLYEGQLQQLYTLLDPIIQDFGPCEVNEGSIHELVLAGGGSNSKYLQNQLTARYEKNGLQVKTSSSEQLLDNTVAQGALLLLGEDNIIKSRIIRDGYFVVQHEEPSPGQEYPREAFYPSRHDNTGRVCVTKFLLHPNKSVSTQRHVSSVRGERVLLFQDKDSDGTGWTIEEDVYRTSKIEKNGVWIDTSGPDSRFVRLQPLVFQISENDTHGFQKLRTQDKTDFYYHIEYEVKLILEGDLMTFEFIVPKTGKFPDANVDGDGNVDMIVQQGTYNCTGDFELFPGERRPWTR